MLVVLDTPGVHNTAMERVLALGDLSLIPVAPSVLDLEASLSTARALRALNKDYYYLLCRCPPNERRVTEAQALLERISGLAAEPLGARVDYLDAIARGLGVCEYRPNGDAANEIRALWNWTAATLAGKRR